MHKKWLLYLPVYQCIWKVANYKKKNDEFFGAEASELCLVEREILIQVIERESLLLKLIANKYNTQKICVKAVKVKGVDIEFCS